MLEILLRLQNNDKDRNDYAPVKSKAALIPACPPDFHSHCAQAAGHESRGEAMAKIAKTADRKKVMDTSKSTDCPKCGKPTRIVKRLKDRERNVPGGIYISCSGCDFVEKL
jgi:DNA-directed RNA polymerase subunit M/transcription elongation factor TFIIS